MPHRLVLASHHPYVCSGQPHSLSPPRCSGGGRAHPGRMGWRNRTIRKCSVSINPSLASNHTSVLRAVQLTFRPAVILAVDVPVGVSHAVPINLFVEIAFFFAFAFFAFSLAVAIAFRTGMIADGQERMHSVSATGPQRNGPGQPGPDRLNRKPQSACSRMPARQQKKRGWGG